MILTFSNFSSFFILKFPKLSSYHHYYKLAATTA